MIVLTVILTSFEIYPLNILIGIIGSVVLYYVAHIHKDKQYMLLNGFIAFAYLAIYIYRTFL